MRIKSQVIDGLNGTGNESTERTKRFRERSVNEANPVLHLKMFGGTASVRATGENGMSFVDEDTGVVRLSNIEQASKRGEVPVHRINSLHNHKLATTLVAAERGIERSGVVVLKTIHPAARKNGAIAQTQMRTII